MSLEEKLDKIRSPKLQNQKETAIVLSAVEDTLRDQNHKNTPTAYFAALLALLSPSISPTNGCINKELATSVVYLLDTVSSFVPAPLLRSKFAQILTSLAPALVSQDAEAPLLRSSIGCLESLLIAQDAAAWVLPQSQITPRRAIAGLLTLTADHRPKVRKRAQDAITNILRNPPPSPSLDHPAVDMCAETALQRLGENMTASATSKKKGKSHEQEQNLPGLMRSLQLVKAVASASGGWPSNKIDSLCELLMGISRSNNNHLTMASFEVFEMIFAGMADDFSSPKLPRLMDAIAELQPSQNDSQLVPPWLAVISRGYDISAQVLVEETFQKLPEIFEMISEFLTSSSYNVRASASECLISFLVNCVPDHVILQPSVYDEKTLEKVVKAAGNLLSVKYQAAWMEVFNVESSLFEVLKWRSDSMTEDVVKIVGELRSNSSFNGKKEADGVLGKAIRAMGPEPVLKVLPLNLIKPQEGQPGRAWLLPVLRDNIANTHLAHFRSEFIPLSEAMFQKILDHGSAEKTMEIKIFETIVQQTWSLLPGYCNLPLDLTVAFDQSFAELLSNLLYTQVGLRPDICRGLQILVESNQEILAVEADEDELRLRSQMTKPKAQAALDHLGIFAGNILAVLFNVYSQIFPQYRGYILQCINSYLSITPEKEILETFNRVTTMLKDALAESTSQTIGPDQQQKKPSAGQTLSTTHTLMDLIITISIYLPLPCFPVLFALTSQILPQRTDPQLQKKAYKLIPRLSNSSTGKLALRDHNEDLQALLLSSASTASAPSRRDRLQAIATTIEHLPRRNLHFIPSILSEVVIAAKEVNEKARSAAFDLLVLMGHKMAEGGIIDQSQIPHMESTSPTAQASLEEYFTMVSAGLVGSTPHMISASVTALARILYEFHGRLEKSVIEELVSTLDLFLASSNREIVRSCLGFMKVVIISLQEEIVKPRLHTLVPGLMAWSKEHKSRFRAKVKNILERAMRRFGYDEISRYCPEDGQKFISNIRKSRERRKRKKNEAVAAGNEGEDEQRRKGKFESEYDKAIYGSDEDESSGAGSGDEDDIGGSKTRSRGRGDSRGINGNRTYIVEDSEEPLDLLDRKTLGNISSTRPVTFKPSKKSKAVVDEDGKLVFGASDEEDEDAMAVDTHTGSTNKGKLEPGDGTLEGGINAYVEAIRGRDAVQRGRGGRLKFSNKRQRGPDEMDVDDEEGKSGKGSLKGGGLAKEKMKKMDPKTQRRGLGMPKVRNGGRVKKAAGRVGGRR